MFEDGAEYGGIDAKKDVCLNGKESQYKQMKQSLKGRWKDGEDDEGWIGLKFEG
jgi:hypothetical protein